MIDKKLSPYAATLLRVSLGAMWISHALLKFVVFTIPGFEAFLASKGMPTFMAWPVPILEIIGGVIILLGFHGRFISLALLPILAAATWTHLGNGWLFTNTGGGWEYPMFLISASVVHALIGDGAFAVGSVKKPQIKSPAYAF
jgi:putative oxidoreductase